MAESTFYPSKVFPKSLKTLMFFKLDSSFSLKAMSNSLGWFESDTWDSYFGTGILGICRDQSFRRCYQQKDKRKVPPYRLKEWKDSDWVAMEDFILTSLFCLLSLQSSLLWVKRNTARDRKDISPPPLLWYKFICDIFLCVYVWWLNKEAIQKSFPNLGLVPIFL